jgi:hypothetical protein
MFKQSGRQCGSRATARLPLNVPYRFFISALGESARALGQVEIGVAAGFCAGATVFAAPHRNDASRVNSTRTAASRRAGGPAQSNVPLIDECGRTSSVSSQCWRGGDLLGSWGVNLRFWYTIDKDCRDENHSPLRQITHATEKSGLKSGAAPFGYPSIGKGDRGAQSDQ